MTGALRGADRRPGPGADRQRAGRPGAALALAVIAGLILACAGLGAVLAAVTGTSALDGYLATTPGGLYAVLATASDSGADTTFGLSAQVLRPFVLLLSAPLVAHLLCRSAAGARTK